MAERIRIITVALMGAGGGFMLYVLDRILSTVTRVGHLLPVIDSYSRLAAWRIFEIAFRLYSLPV